MVWHDLRRFLLQGAVAAAFLSAPVALAQTGSPCVIPDEVVGSYFVAADGFETRIVHPAWNDDRLVVEDVRVRGSFPLMAGSFPIGVIGLGVRHPASMVGGILTYAAPALFSATYPQTVVFKRTEGPVTGGLHAVMIFEGPPEGSPSAVEALTLTDTEWKNGGHFQW